MMTNFPKGLAPWVAALLLFGAACSDDTTPSDVEVDGEEEDVGGEDNAPEDVGDDDDEEEDTSQVEDDVPPEDEPEPRLPLGALCDESEECDSNICFRIAGVDQGFCSKFCLELENCPEEGFDCLFLPNEDEEISKVCVPLDLCIDRDGDEFGTGPACAGRDCDDENPDRNPAADEVCDGIDNDCDTNIDDNPIDANVACDTGDPGVCSAGRLRCDDGELRCDALRFGSTEVCDGIDTDCDGQIDEDADGNPIAETCYLGPEGTEGVGACQAGVRACRDGLLSDCEGQVLPFTELCDGLDNDCDAEIDEGAPSAGVACDTGAEGICRQGQTECGEGEVRCVQLEEPVEETCDGLDNDCDGDVDEDEDGELISELCYEGDEGTEGVGLCQGGTRTCRDGDLSACEGQVLPVDELCDGLDNDCDVEIDEGNPAGGRICSTGEDGVCARGETACGEEGLVCIPLEEAADELCDNRDNDCDSEIDEGLDGEPIERECYSGPEGTLGLPFAVCRAGVQTCQGGVFSSCVGEVRPSAERCDGVDNDCDGQVDEGDPGGGQICSTGLPGVCAAGLTVCSEEGELVCAQQQQAADEICDGIDNDCDGLVDEGPDDEPLTESCYTGREGSEGVGICRAGVKTCQGGVFSGCVGEVRPGVERCDGVDTDCDGELDNGSPGAGVECATGEPGVCAAGVTACNEDGELVCVQRQQAGAEVCDNEDNDCDGLVDEGPDDAPLTRSCYNGDPNTLDLPTNVCRAGVQTCQGGTFGGCVGEVRPSAERCDGIDNDCDNVVDDGNPGGGVPCSTGLQGVCAAGVTQCDENGDIICAQSVQAGVEICDGLDNDCDGQVDEGEDNEPLQRSCFDGAPEDRGRGICQDGVEVCVAGQFGACQGQVLPTVEICDGVDNNCSGVIDDGNPGGGIGCTTGRPGICALGQTVCAGGEITCQADNEPAAELCDGVDNDCDGVPDNGFDGLGDTCFDGEGICRRAGVVVCNPEDLSGDPICNAVAVEGNEFELCDFDDDDCDGEIDEDFIVNDVYSTVEHCGGCDVDCNNRWPGGPALFNVAPLCVVQGQSAQCDFECVAPFVDLDGVPDNGCEFAPDTDAIYVSRPANGGDDGDAACGDFDAPCATIARGQERAQAEGRGRVRVSGGLYRENVRLVAGVDLLGGHDPVRWQRNPAIQVTVITGQTLNPQGPDRMAVVAEGITTPTEFSGFTVNAENAAAGGNSVGLYVLNSDDSLLVRDNIIFAGTGGVGGNGASGGSGLGGRDGGQGISSATRVGQCPSSDADCSDRAGGAGGERICPNTNGVGTTDVSGGSGGNSNDPNRTTRSFPGGDGGNNGGDGGIGGGHLTGSFNNGRTCTVGDTPTEPGPGDVGEAGADGAGGTPGGAPTGRFDPVSGQWRGFVAGDGVPGEHGSGGGGGGAAAGVDALLVENTLYYGATGGGGGSGGCAGFSGGGGTAGGGSFAVMLVFTLLDPVAEEMPRLEDNRLVRGLGNDGGNGGSGGAGGDPGLGAEGGAGLDGDTFSFCLFDGAIGAEGGRGGHGGGGGGGPGGASFDVLILGGVDPGYVEANTFELGDGVETAGRGGLGGASSNDADGTGDNGTDGEAGNLLRIP